MLPGGLELGSPRKNRRIASTGLRLGCCMEPSAMKFVDWTEQFCGAPAQRCATEYRGHYLHVAPRPRRASSPRAPLRNFAKSTETVDDAAPCHPSPPIPAPPPLPDAAVRSRPPRRARRRRGHCTAPRSRPPPTTHTPVLLLPRRRGCKTSTTPPAAGPRRRLPLHDVAALSLPFPIEVLPLPPSSLPFRNRASMVFVEIPLRNLLLIL